MKKLEPRKPAKEKGSGSTIKAVYLPVEMWNKINAEAVRIGRSQNGTIRAILEAYFNDAETNDV